MLANIEHAEAFQVNSIPIGETLVLTRLVCTNTISNLQYCGAVHRQRGLSWGMQHAIE